MNEDAIKILRWQAENLKGSHGEWSLKKLQDEADETYHQCPDWDFMVICKDDPEYDCCTCCKK